MQRAKVKHFSCWHFSSLLFPFLVLHFFTCAQVVYIWLLLYIIEHMSEVLTFMCLSSTQAQTDTGNRTATLSAIVCWAKISEAKPELDTSDSTATQFSARIPCPALPPSTGVICKFSNQHSQYFLGSRLHSSNFYDTKFNLSIETIIQS